MITETGYYWSMQRGNWSVVRVVRSGSGKLQVRDSGVVTPIESWNGKLVGPIQRPDTNSSTQ